MDSKTILKCPSRQTDELDSRDTRIATMGRGQLLFKGDDKRSAAKKKKKSAKKKHKENTEDRGEEIHREQRASEDDAIVPDEAISGSSIADASAPPAAAAAADPPLIKKGTGKITVSGTVVTGYDTRFDKELAVGDALLVGGEMRVVTMRLSNTSINLSSAFSTGIPLPTSFQFVSKPRNTGASSSSAAQASSASGTKHPVTKYGEMYASTSQLVYREKTETGSYRIKKEEVDGGKGFSRGDLLYMRSKKTSDRFC